MKTKIRINLCASPRNISTALMYSFGNRTDTSVVDEPLYAYYLSESGEKHPGRNEILNSMDQNADSVIEDLTSKDYNTPFVFFKNMTHHYYKLDDQQLDKLLLNTVNIILIRDPYEMIRSFAKVIPEPKESDLGMHQQLALIKRLKRLNTLACIVDSNEVLKNPKEELERICFQCGIPFKESMLSWEAGKRIEDGCWAKYWYEKVHSSNGFKPYQPSDEKIPDRLIPLYESCLEQYNAILEYKKI